ncbi:Zinc finger CCCH domain-containing protein 14 [Capsicum annuum]|uniref:Zinc finger CCCH domain-containing protein 14 n=1 Tax=Capsicum annuum TaxID=4072 RepID=A0A2G3AJU3_CAPAN|nr:Zinc finger CCCH domain-containing protein 14 [Capsicum annuum]
MNVKKKPKGLVQVAKIEGLVSCNLGHRFKPCALQTKHGTQVEKGLWEGCYPRVSKAAGGLNENLYTIEDIQVRVLDQVLLIYVFPWEDSVFKIERKNEPGNFIYLVQIKFLVYFLFLISRNQKAVDLCTSGCSYGEGCHFLHYVPGYTAMSQLSNMGSNPAPPFGRNGASFSDGPVPTVKSKFCSRFNTAEGCRFGDKCHFAHSEMEVGKQVRPGYNDFQAKGPLSGFSPMVRGPGGPFKTKMCANFSKGLCTFGEKCHFAHGLNELQKPLA